MTTPSASPVTLEGIDAQIWVMENVYEGILPGNSRAEILASLRELKQRREAEAEAEVEATRSVQSATMPEPVAEVIDFDEGFKFGPQRKVQFLRFGEPLPDAGTLLYGPEVHTYYGDLLAAEREKNAVMKIDFDAQQSDIDRLLESLTNESNARVAAESRLAAERLKAQPQNPCCCVADSDNGEIAHLCKWHEEIARDFNKIKRMAETGTVGNFLKLPDDAKRRVLAHGIRESTLRKKAESRLAKVMERLREPSDAVLQAGALAYEQSPCNDLMGPMEDAFKAMSSELLREIGGEEM